MRVLLPVVYLALLSITVPVARSQSSSTGAVTWDSSNPQEVKGYVGDAFLNEVRVSVVVDDGTSIAGKISSVGNDDFLVVPPRSQPVTVKFASVRRISWQQWKESKASRIRYQVRDLAAQPNLVATVHPRHQPELAGRIGKVRELTFVLVEEKSGVERELDYRDVDRISAPGSTAGPTASEILKNVGLIAAGVFLLPLTVLMALIGWDGC
jgi:hypothetical protein